MSVDGDSFEGITEIPGVGCAHRIEFNQAAIDAEALPPHRAEDVRAALAALGAASDAALPLARTLPFARVARDAAATVLRVVDDPECANTPGHPEWECEKWAGEGECENNPGFMRANCKKSCGLCGALPEAGQMKPVLPPPYKILRNTTPVCRF